MLLYASHQLLHVNVQKQYVVEGLQCHLIKKSFRFIKVASQGHCPISLYFITFTDGKWDTLLWKHQKRKTCWERRKTGNVCILFYRIYVSRTWMARNARPENKQTVTTDSKKLPGGIYVQRTQSFSEVQHEPMPAHRETLMRLGLTVLPTWSPFLCRWIVHFDATLQRRQCGNQIISSSITSRPQTK